MVIKMGNGGGGEIHHYTTVYQTSPAVQKELDEKTAQLKTFEKEAKIRGDPNLYKINSDNLLNNLVTKLDKMDLKDIIKKKTGENHIGFIGPISAGKTSMINALFGINLPVALGHCTDKCEVVHTVGKNIIWDVCGTNDDFKFYIAENLSFVKGLDKIVLVFDNDVAMISNMLKVIVKLNKNIIIIRTKVDQHSDSNSRSIQAEKILDKDKVKNLLGIEFETYCVSSHNVMNGKMQYDWNIVKTKIGLV